MNTMSKSPIDRRCYPRHPAESVSIEYDDGETFLFSYLEDISEMGIFIRSSDPFPVGTRLSMRFRDHPLELEGEVVWVNPVNLGLNNRNPGMGVRFLDLDADKREAVVDVVKTVAYLDSQPLN